MWLNVVATLSSLGNDGRMARCGLGAQMKYLKQPAEFAEVHTKKEGFSGVGLVAVMESFMNFIGQGISNL